MQLYAWVKAICILKAETLPIGNIPSFQYLALGMKAKDKTLRSIKISGHPFVGNNSGFFHRWCTEPLYDTGQIFSKTLALVELVDGQVKLIEPQYLQFTEPYNQKENS